MNIAAPYLRIPADHFTDMGLVLQWSADGEAVEYGDGRTFAFSQEVVSFVEGFASQRPLIHFGYVLQLIWMLRPNWLTAGDPAQVHRLHAAFCAAGKPYRNAGVFFAAVCAEVPGVAQWVSAAEVARIFVPGPFSVVLDASASRPAPIEKPPVRPAAFEAQILQATAAFDNDALWHWFRHGRGPVKEEAAAVADALRRAPRTLADALDDASRRQRLAGATPFVELLTGALALPPRRLARPEMPLGGYADVTTRGGPEQILPSQFALDDLEFVRRCAERELLYYRREEPHDRTREELVVLLDQGVRTWGSVRLVLAAAVFALGRLAGARRLPFLVAASSSHGVVQDPLQMTEDAFAAVLESSDLTADPGPAVERVLEETDAPRDVVLLTHPRNLGEPGVRDAARRVRPGSRLFAVAVDDHGDVEFSELRHGVPVRLSRFRVDLNRTAPPPERPMPPDSLAPWRGDVEPVPFPFVFGVGPRIEQFDFDGSGQWLVTATSNGLLHATRTDGSGVEVLPGALIEGRLLSSVRAVLSVVGGVAVVGSVPGTPHEYMAVVGHYNFIRRTCTTYSLGRLPGWPWQWHYIRDLHSIVVVGRDKYRAVDLASGGRLLAAGAPDGRASRAGLACDRVQQGAVTPPGAHPDNVRWVLDSTSGTMYPERATPHWKPFIPLSDGRPMLQGATLLDTRLRGRMLAAAFKNGPYARQVASVSLCLFRGPEGTPLATYAQASAQARFNLSRDGRLLARQIGARQLEVREAESGQLLAVTGVCEFHNNVTAAIGDRCLLLRCGGFLHRIGWARGRLDCACWKAEPGLLAGANAVRDGAEAVRGPLPAFLSHASDRFIRTARNHLIVAVDVFGQTALFEVTGNLVCMVFAFRERLAAWAPPDVRYGPAALLGAPPTPGADAKIGRALRDAWERSEPRSS